MRTGCSLEGDSQSQEDDEDGQEQEASQQVSPSKPRRALRRRSSKEHLPRPLSSPPGRHMRTRSSPQKARGSSLPNRNTPKPRVGDRDGDWKKCTSCKKWKQDAEFYQQQGSCKECALLMKSLKRTCQAQGHSAWFSKLALKSPQEHAELLRQYGAERRKLSKTQRINFSITTFQESYQTKVGERIQEEGEMMHLQEYLDWAAGAKEGYLNAAEARARWDSYMAQKMDKRTSRIARVAPPREVPRLSGKLGTKTLQ